MEKREPLVVRARELISAAGFGIGDAHCALEVKIIIQCLTFKIKPVKSKPPVAWDKGRASIYILRTAFGVDWSDRIRIIYAGDDVTDEDAMQALKGMAFSFRVVNTNLTQTSANMRWVVMDQNIVSLT